jgi:hypothetical protein
MLNVLAGQTTIPKLVIGPVPGLPTLGMPIPLHLVSTLGAGFTTVNRFWVFVLVFVHLEPLVS